MKTKIDTFFLLFLTPNIKAMGKFKNKGTKCPTLWLGIDKMVQNKAKAFALELLTARPDLVESHFDGAGNRQDNTKINDKSDISFCHSRDKKRVISQILSSLIAFL